MGVSGLANDWMFGSNSLRTVMRRSLVRGHSNGDPFSTEYGAVMRRSIDTAASLQAALAQVSVPALSTTGVALGAAAPVTLANDGLAREAYLLDALDEQERAVLDRALAKLLERAHTLQQQG